MSNEATAEWPKDDPKVDGLYWWRADANDHEPDIHSVVQGRFYQIGQMHSILVENFGGEWLGPITPEQFAEVGRLREMVAWMLASKGAYLFHEDECPWNYGPDDSCNCRVFQARAALSGKKEGE